jgi:hypothetical protein
MFFFPSTINNIALQILGEELEAVWRTEVDINTARAWTNI